MLKAIFLIDNVPAVAMFMPIIDKLPKNWDVSIGNYYVWNKKGQEEIEQFLTKMSLKSIKIDHLQNIEMLLLQEKPNIVVLSRDTTSAMEEDFVKYCRFMHIPTLLVPHGVWSPEERKNWTLGRTSSWIKHIYDLGLQGIRLIKIGGFSFRYLISSGLFLLRRDLKPEPVFDGHGGCSKIAVYGNAIKELLISEGVNPDSIIVTGNPKFDALYSVKANGNNTNLRETLGISNDEKVVVLLTDYLVEIGLWTERQRTQFIKVIVEAANNLPMCKLIIKIHPLSEREEDYLKIVKNESKQPIICRNVFLPELLNTCDLAITLMSTAGLEAMAMGKILVVVNLFNNLSPFNEAGGAIVVRKKEDLLPALKVLLSQGLDAAMKQNADKYVYQQAYVQDGKAANRIANLIIQMVKN